METLIRFIEKVENRVLYFVTAYTEKKDNMSYTTDIWVHQLNGKVICNPTTSVPVSAASANWIRISRMCRI